VKSTVGFRAGLPAAHRVGVARNLEQHLALPHVPIRMGRTVT